MRLLARCTAAAATAATAILAGVAAAQGPVELKPVRATDRVWYVQGAGGMASRANAAFNSNAAFVVTDAGVVVFDTLGTPALGAQLKQAIAKVTAQPVRRVIVSHYHADHF